MSAEAAEASIAKLGYQNSGKQDGTSTAEPLTDLLGTPPIPANDPRNLFRPGCVRRMLQKIHRPG